MNASNECSICLSPILEEQVYYHTGRKGGMKRLKHDERFYCSDECRQFAISRHHVSTPDLQALWVKHQRHLKAQNHFLYPVTARMSS
jgi:hypothetical protein